MKVPNIRLGDKRYKHSGVGLTKGRGRGRTRARVVAATAATALMASACGGASTPSGAKSTTAQTGNPNLHGEHIVIDIGSPTPVLSKATAYVAVEILNSWGAQASLDSIGACGKGGELVLTGRAQVTLCPASVALNAGLVAFGSNQPRVNYLLIAKTAIATPAALSGRTVGLNNPTGTEATLLPSLETHYHLTHVSTVVLGTQPALLGALASGHIDAGMVLPEQWMALKKKTSSLRLLASIATVLPDFADSYLMARSSWLKAHRGLAVAIDEAWLEARKVFNSNESSWVAAAERFTGNRYSASVAQAVWQDEQSLDIWPNSGFGFSTATLQYNAQIAYSTHAAKRLLPVSRWTDQTIWNAADQQIFGSKKTG